LKTNLRRLGLKVTAVEAESLPRGMKEWAASEFRFLKDLVSARGEMYHAVDVPGAKTAVVLAKRPLVTTVHDVEAELVPESLNARGQMYMRFSRELARGSDRIIVPFEWTKRQVTSIYRIPTERIRVVNYGVDHSSFYPLRRARGSKKRILYVGEINRLKGVGVLLDAFSIVLREIKEVQMTFVGKGLDQDELNDLARRLRIESHVLFTGFVPDRKLPYYYHQADVFVWPSRLGFGLTLLQAMACGLPVVAARAAEIPDLIGSSGLLVEPDSPRELAGAIIRILSDPRLSAALGRKARVTAQAYSWERMAKETLRVYDELVPHVK